MKLKKVFVLDEFCNLHDGGLHANNADELEALLNDGWDIMRVDQPAIISLADTNRINLANFVVRLVYILEKDGSQLASGPRTIEV